ncbi:hypothetical protein [Methanospirillum sp.]
MYASDDYSSVECEHVVKKNKDVNQVKPCGVSDEITPRQNEQISQPVNENQLRGIPLVVDAQLLHGLTCYRCKEFPSKTYDEVRELCLISCYEAGLEVRI